MPLKSKAQLRKLYVLESEGKVPKGTAKKWLKHTKNYKSLPERKSKKQACFAIDFCKFLIKISSLDNTLLNTNNNNGKLTTVPPLPKDPLTVTEVRENRTMAKGPYGNKKKPRVAEILQKFVGPFAKRVLTFPARNKHA